MASDDDESVCPDAIIMDRIKEPSDDEILFTIAHESDKYEITRETKESLRTAIVYNAHPPTHYYRMVFAIEAVCRILDIPEMLEFYFPQTPDEISDFDWDEVTAGFPKTYPIGKKPTAAQFKIVEAIYLLVVAELDVKARQAGMPRSGATTYVTFKARWKEWRDYCAVYRHLNPGMTLQAVYDLMAYELKLLGSKEKIDQKVSDNIMKHLHKLRLASQKAARLIAREAALQRELEEEMRKDYEESQKEEKFKKEEEKLLCEK